MRKGTLIAVLLSACITGSHAVAVAQDNAAVDSSYANGYYRDRLAFFRELPDRRNEIVFLGNSITEAGDWQEILPGKTIANRGISGDNSFGVFARLNEVVASKPAKIFLLIGVNDLKRGTAPAYILQNYERIILYIKTASPRTEIYLQSVLPVNEKMLASIYARISNDIIRALNVSAANIAAQHGVTYIDLHKQVFSDANGQLKKELTTDGLHLKPSAYLQWVAFLRKMKYL